MSSLLKEELHDPIEEVDERSDEDASPTQTPQNETNNNEEKKK